MLTLCLFSFVQADVALPSGIFYQNTVDMKVKTKGGMLTIERSWYNNKWFISRNWTNIKLVYENVSDIGGGSASRPNRKLKLIERNNLKYENIGESKIYRIKNKGEGKRFIIKNIDGFHWQYKNGKWFDYDIDGLLLKFGYRNITQAYFIRNADKQIITVKDTDNNTIYQVSYLNGHVYQISDNSIPRRRTVTYDFIGEKLQTVTDVLGHQTHYSYSGNKDNLKMSSFTDARGHKITIDYNNFGDVKSLRDEKQIGFDYGYDYNRVKKEYSTIVRHTSGLLIEDRYNNDAEVIQSMINGKIIYNNIIDNDYNGNDRRVTRINQRGNSTIREYDTSGNLVKITFPEGSTKIYKYAGVYNNLIEKINENGVKTQYQYDDNGYQIKKIEAVGTSVERITSYTVDNYGYYLTIATQANENSEATLIKKEYNNNGNLIKYTDAEGRISQYTYNHIGKRLSKTTNNKMTQYEYNKKGYLISKITPLNKKTSYIYDENNNVIEKNIYASDNTLYSIEIATYDYRNQLILTIDAHNNKIKYFYDSKGNLIEIKNPMGNSNIFEYNLNNQLAKIIFPEGNIIKYIYGNQGTKNSGLLTKIIYPTYQENYLYNSRSWKTEVQYLAPNQTTKIIKRQYTKNGKTIFRENEKKRQTKYEYDALDRRIKIIEPNQIVTQYKYDNRDNIKQVIDANNHIIRAYQYNKNNERIVETKPEGQTIKTAYNNQDLIQSHEDSLGKKQFYSYDDDGKLIQIQIFSATNQTIIADKNIIFNYNKVGQLINYNDGFSKASYLYDKQDRKTQETVTYNLGQSNEFSKTYHYNYNNIGNKQSFTNPEGIEFKYYYNKNNQLQTIQIPHVGSINAANYQWTAPQTITFPGGHQINALYDGFMRPKSIQAKTVANQNINKLAYQYDLTNNITQKTINEDNIDYQYNSLDRLTEINYAEEIDLTDESYSYDPVGNRLTSHKTTGTWNYNDNNELLDFDNVQYISNDNSQLIEKTVDGIKTIFIYNVNNRLAEIKNNLGESIVRYQYDPFGRRIVKELLLQNIKTYYLYSQEGLIAEYDETGNLIQSYGYKPNTIFFTNPIFSHRPDFINQSKGGYVYYINDHLGTPQKLITETGRVVWHGLSEAFGKTNILIDDFRNDLRFSGQIFDAESGLNYNIYRYYDFDVGRYITSDPIGLIGGINAFVYVRGNPTNIIDPFGQWGLVGALIGAIGGAISGYMTGGWGGAAKGAAFGAAFGLLPIPGGALWGAAGAGGANVAGQLTGKDDFNLCKALGAAAGGAFGSRFKSPSPPRRFRDFTPPPTIKEVGNGVVDGVTSGAGENAGNYVGNNF